MGWLRSARERRKARKRDRAVYRAEHGKAPGHIERLGEAEVSSRTGYTGPQAHDSTQEGRRH